MTVDWKVIRKIHSRISVLSVPKVKSLHGIVLEMLENIMLPEVESLLESRVGMREEQQKEGPEPVPSDATSVKGCNSTSELFSCVNFKLHF